MAKEGSVAPKERVNIVYKPATEGSEDVELPLKVLVVGDFTGKTDERPLEDRKPINVDKDNFDSVMREHGIGVEIAVPDRLTEEEGVQLPVSLNFTSMKDFTPEGVLQQVPELKKLMALRDALTALKGPLGNKPAFRKQLKQLLDNDETRKQLLEEIALGGDDN